MAAKKVEFDQLVTLRQYVDAEMTNGYISCSASIHPDEILRIDSVDCEWWIKNNDVNGGNGRSFSCHPNTHVYIINQKRN